MISDWLMHWLITAQTVRVGWLKSAIAWFFCFASLLLPLFCLSVCFHLPEELHSILFITSTCWKEHPSKARGSVWRSAHVYNTLCMCILGFVCCTEEGIQMYFWHTSDGRTDCLGSDYLSLEGFCIADCLVLLLVVGRGVRGRVDCYCSLVMSINKQLVQIQHYSMYYNLPSESLVQLINLQEHNVIMPTVQLWENFNEWAEMNEFHIQ